MASLSLPDTRSRSQELSQKPVLSRGTDTAVVRAAQGWGAPHKWGVEETAAYRGERGPVWAWDRLGGVGWAWVSAFSETGIQRERGTDS